MCAHFGVVRCVLCVSQRFGHRALTVACGKPGPDGRHWPGDGFMTKRSSGRCPEAESSPSPCQQLRWRAAAQP